MDDANERIDDTGFGGMRVIQSREFGYGVDSVLLAAFAAGETGAKGIAAGSVAADLGTGNGIVAFILSQKVKDIHITGYELQQPAYSRAVRALDLNIQTDSSLRDRMGFINCDINDIKGMEDMDAVVSNPPYFRRQGAIASSSAERYLSRHETTADIRAFADKAASMLKRGGGLYIVHRPDRLADIMTAMRSAGTEPKYLQMVVPKEGEAPNIVLICGIKAAGPELHVLPQIAVHKNGGGYTDEILRLYGKL